MLKVTLDLSEGRERLKRIPEAVRAALAERLEAIAERFVAAAAAAAPKKTGALAADIRDKIRSSARQVIATVDIGPGKPRAYASAQERGAKTAAHEILATKAKALAFLAGGSIHFAGRVQNPGAVIPRHPFMQPTLTAMTSEIHGEVSDAAKEAAADA